MKLFEAIGGTEGCEKLSASFYARVKRDPVLRPLFPGKSLRCAIEAFSSFLVQFLGGPSEDAQHRWYISLLESHSRFHIGPSERDAWLANMRATLAEVPDAGARDALNNLFTDSSAYIAGVDSKSSMDDEVAERWEKQLHIDRAIAAINQGDAGTAIQQAELGRRLSRSAQVGLLIRMIPIAPEYVRESVEADPALVQERYFGRSLLHYAAAAGNLSVVELLLDLGADPNLPDAGGHPPLYRLANECRTPDGSSIVRALVRAGAKVNTQSGVKRTSALHMAARRGNIAMGRALLEFGADPDARDSDRVTPMQRARNCHKHEFAAALAR